MAALALSVAGSALLLRAESNLPGSDNLVART